MPVIFSKAADAPPERKAVVVEGDTYYKSEWMDSGRDPAFSPNAFLVEQAPGVSLRAHFHRHNQFQLFVRGDGRLGAHPVGALTVHYAGAYSAYGPLVAGSEGLAYFTLRCVHETGNLSVTHDRAQMRRGPKRMLHSRPLAPAAAEELRGLGESSIHELIPRQPDGVAARLHTLAPGSAADAMDPAGSAGQFHVVTAGRASVAGRSLGRWESAFVREPVKLAAHEEGAQIVCMQLPFQAEEYR